VLAQTVERTQCVYTSSVVCPAPLKAFAQDGLHIQPRTIDKERTCNFFAFWCKLIFHTKTGCIEGLETRSIFLTIISYRQ